jgi:hypothetical protein
VIKQKVTVKTLELAIFLNIQVMVKFQICKCQVMVKKTIFSYVYPMVVNILTYPPQQFYIEMDIQSSKLT